MSEALMIDHLAEYFAFYACAGLLGGLVLFLLSQRPAPPTPAAAAPVQPEAKKPEEEKKYTYDEYMRDMEEGLLSVTDILDKCRVAGGIPKKPKDAPERPVDDRIKSRMAWFEELAKQAPNLKLVPPPPPPRPVVAFKGQLVRCPYCPGETGYPLSATAVYPYRNPRPPRDKNGKCTSCGGTGFVVITGG